MPSITLQLPRHQSNSCVASQEECISNIYSSPPPPPSLFFERGLEKTKRFGETKHLISNRNAYSLLSLTISSSSSSRVYELLLKRREIPGRGLKKSLTSRGCLIIPVEGGKYNLSLISIPVLPFRSCRVACQVELDISRKSREGIRIFFVARSIDKELLK